ncbi:unnamed protein product [Symbiodinium microadriaticum]|nr:unnamed protein product [Symbiodinium microadriaticum]
MNQELQTEVITQLDCLWPFASLAPPTERFHDYKTSGFWKAITHAQIQGIYEQEERARMAKLGRKVKTIGILVRVASAAEATLAFQQSAADSAEENNSFPSLDSMMVEPAQQEPRETEASAVCSSSGSAAAAGRVVRSVQKQVNQLRKVEVQLRRTDQEFQETHDKWQAWQKEMTKTYAKERVKYLGMMEKLQEERQELQDLLENVLTDLQQAMVAEEKQTNTEHSISDEVLAEWANLVKAPAAEESELTELLEGALSGKTSLRPKEAARLIEALKADKAPTPPATPPWRHAGYMATTLPVPPTRKQAVPMEVEAAFDAGKALLYRKARLSLLGSMAKAGPQPLWAAQLDGKWMEVVRADLQWLSVKWAITGLVMVRKDFTAFCQEQKAHLALWALYKRAMAKRPDMELRKTLFQTLDKHETRDVDSVSLDSSWEVAWLCSNETIDLATVQCEYELVSAGLAGLSRHAKAAALDALSRLLYEHHSKMVVLLLLEDRDAQVWRAALKFTKVVVFVLPKDDDGDDDDDEEDVVNEDSVPSMDIALLHQLVFNSYGICPPVHLPSETESETSTASGDENI